MIQGRDVPAGRRVLPALAVSVILLLSAGFGGVAMADEATTVAAPAVDVAAPAVDVVAPAVAAPATEVVAPAPAEAQAPATAESTAKVITAKAEIVRTKRAVKRAKKVFRQAEKRKVAALMRKKGSVRSAQAGFVNICHATGSATNPYVEIRISTNGLEGHGDHANDIIPAPAGGCPGVVGPPPEGRITICHATASATNPFVEITVSVNGLEGHGDHTNDIIPAPAGGCPGGTTPPPPPPPPPPVVTPPTVAPTPPTVVPAATPVTTPVSTPVVTPPATPAEEEEPTEEEPEAEDEPEEADAPEQAAAAPRAVAAKALPFTGFDTGQMIGLGLFLLLAGFALRRASTHWVRPAPERGPRAP
jgi:outer membrane biosynthesis protein TonB